MTQEVLKFARSKRGRAWLATLSVAATRRQEYSYADTNVSARHRCMSDGERLLRQSLGTVTSELAYKVGKAAHKMCMSPSKRGASELLRLANLNASYL
jgi:hypothetical protein